MGLESLNSRDKFILARWTYSIGKPIYSNAEYTLLLNAVKAANPNDEYVNRSWSSDPCPTELLKSLGLQDLIYPVVLSDKTESIPSLNTDYEVKLALELITDEGTISYKHDGWNIQANYYNNKLVNISTRGRSSDALDVSSLKDRFPVEIPFSGKCKIVSELTIGKSNFEICKTKFGNVNSRSAVSTVLAKPEFHYLLDFHSFDIHGYTEEGKNKFEILREWGFPIPAYVVVHNYEEVLKAIDDFSNNEPNYESPTDGLVYDGVIKKAIRLRTWEEPIYKSYVIDYYEQYGPYRISPSVMIKPVIRNGTTQRRVNMTNWARIIQFNLQIGAPIAFRVASGAIADFDEEATRLLHEEYKGTWNEFKTFIDRNEDIVRTSAVCYTGDNNLDELYECDTEDIEE